MADEVASATKSNDGNAQLVEGRGGPAVGPKMGTHLHHVHKSIVADTINNNKDINFSTNVQQAPQATFAHSVLANSLNVHGNIETHMNYTSSDSKILEWLTSQSPFNFDEKQEENQKRAWETPKTGKWLLEESDPFCRWRDGDLKYLWLRGIPGAGKSVLASTIIKHLQTERRNMPCLYVYFDYKNPKAYDLKSLLASLLVQLVRAGDSTCKDVHDLYQSYVTKGMLPTPQEYIRALESEARKQTRVFIVIDALDECPHDSEDNTREDFVKNLHQLPDTVHLLFTSRPDGSIIAMLHPQQQQPPINAELETLKIVAQNRELRQYVKTFINNRTALRTLVNTRDNRQVHRVSPNVSSAAEPSFLDQIANTVAERSQGMFLLARLHMEFLASVDDLHSLEQGLKTLPKTINDVYKAAFERISGQSSSRQTLALNALSWLVFAQRPLTIAEFKHAVGVKVGDPTKLHLVSEGALTSVCAGLIVFDPDTNSVELAHYTAKDHLNTHAATIFKKLKRTMAETCLTYLLLDEFEHAPQSAVELAERKQAWPFYSYAADHWANHMLTVAGSGEGEEQTQQQKDMYKLAIRFLCDQEKVKGALKAMSDYRFSMEVGVSALHIAAYFGLEELARRLVKIGFKINAVTQRGETALHWAAFYQRPGMIAVLIAAGADVNIADRDGKTALHQAVMKEDGASVEALLDVLKVNLEHEDSQRWTPLRLAASIGNCSLIKKLIDGGAEIDAQDEDGYTALRWAVKKGRVQAIDELLKLGASLHTVSRKDGWTMILWAADGGREGWIYTLIKAKVNVDAPYLVDGCTPLLRAVEHAYGMVAWLLIRAGAKVGGADNSGQTPLHVSVSRDDRSTAWMLLENGANIDAKTNKGLTPLHIAASKGYESLVWLLLDRDLLRTQLSKGPGSRKAAASDGIGPNGGVNARTKRNETPLHLACEGGHSRTVSILLRNGANPSEENTSNQTALHIAIEKGNLAMQKGHITGEIHLDVVRVLLEHMPALVRYRDHEDCTPLHYAATLGRLDIMKMLVAHRAQVDVLDANGNTPLHCAVRESHLEAMKFLVELMKANVNLQNGNGRSPLHVAAAAGDMKMVEELRGLRDVDTTLRDAEGRTAWQRLRELRIEVDEF